MSDIPAAKKGLTILKEDLYELEIPDIMAGIEAAISRMTRLQKDFLPWPTPIRLKLEIVIFNEEAKPGKKGKLPEAPAFSKEFINQMFAYLSETPPLESKFASFIESLREDWYPSDGTKGGLSQLQYEKLWEVYYVRSNRIEND